MKKKNDGSIDFLYKVYSGDHEYLSPDKKWAFSYMHLHPIISELKARALKHGTKGMSKDEIYIVATVLKGIPEMKTKVIELGLE